MNFSCEITFLLVYLAAVCLAVMDKVAHHYYKSVFKLLNNTYWWDKKVSWHNKYKDRDVAQGRKKLFWKINYPVQLTDAWHFFKMWFIIFIMLAIVLGGTIIVPPIDFVIYGVFFNMVFTLHYDYLFDLNFYHKLNEYKNKWF